MNIYSLIIYNIFIPTLIRGNTFTDRFWDLYDAVTMGTRILHDVTEGVGAVSRAVRAIEDLMMAKERKTSLKKDVSGGCHALAVAIHDDELPMQKMSECCDFQKECYTSSCAVNKKQCDFDFKSCLYMLCDEYNKYERSYQNKCKGAAKIIFSGAMALGYQQYAGAQSMLGCSGTKKK